MSLNLHNPLVINELRYERVGVITRPPHPKVTVNS
jgi:hypothetical protein